MPGPRWPPVPELVWMEASQPKCSAGLRELFAELFHAEAEEETILGFDSLGSDQKLMSHPHGVVDGDAVVEDSCFVGFVVCLVPNDHRHNVLQRKPLERSHSFFGSKPSPGRR